MNEAAAPFGGPEWQGSDIALIVLSLMALFVALPPFCWHLKMGSMPATTLMLWPIILCLINVVNGFLWHNDDQEHWWLGQGLCDTEAKITVASFAGFNCALAAITRNHARVMDSRRLAQTINDKQQCRERAIQRAICWGCPVYLMIIHYVVQTSRYVIYAMDGCEPTFDSSWSSFVLIFMWPVVFAIVGVYYAGM